MADLRGLIALSPAADPAACGQWGLLHLAWSRALDEDNYPRLRFLLRAWRTESETARVAIWETVCETGASLEVIRWLHEQLPWDPRAKWYDGLLWALSRDAETVRWYLTLPQVPDSHVYAGLACHHSRIYFRHSPETLHVLQEWCPSLVPHQGLQRQPNLYERVCQALEYNDEEDWSRAVKDADPRWLCECLREWVSTLAADWNGEIEVLQLAVDAGYVTVDQIRDHFQALGVWPRETPLDGWLGLHCPGHQQYSGLMGALSLGTPEQIQALIPLWEGQQRDLLAKGLDISEEVPPEVAEIFYRWLDPTPEECREALPGCTETNHLWRLLVGGAGPGHLELDDRLLVTPDHLAWAVEHGRPPPDRLQVWVGRLWKAARHLVWMGEMWGLDVVWASYPSLEGQDNQWSKLLGILDYDQAHELLLWLIDRGYPVERLPASYHRHSDVLALLETMGVSLHPRGVHQLALHRREYARYATLPPLGPEEASPRIPAWCWLQWPIERQQDPSSPVAHLHPPEAIEATALARTGHPVAVRCWLDYRASHSTVSLLQWDDHLVALWLRSRELPPSFWEHLGEEPLRLDSVALRELLRHCPLTALQWLETVRIDWECWDQDTLPVIREWLAERAGNLQLECGDSGALYLWTAEEVSGWTRLATGVYSRGPGTLEEAREIAGRARCKSAA